MCGLCGNVPRDIGGMGDICQLVGAADILAAL